VIGLDGNTGALLQTFPTKSYVDGGVSVVNGKLYACDGEGYIYCFDTGLTGVAGYNSVVRP
jgi:outer membrane protein assembly factor BamB